MLTRLKIKGFKNLVDVDVRFGPFTCIAGPNAVGKSNLFDAIRFLSALASTTLMDAAFSVRSKGHRNTDVRNLFHRVGDQIDDRMCFEVEMITPKEAVDDLGQTASATANFLRYTLELGYHPEVERVPSMRGPLEILREELVHIPLSEAGRSLPFAHSPAKWRRSALRIKHRTAPFISTGEEGGNRVIRLHQDGGSRGRPVINPATQPRTVLAAANTAESPTALCAKREMESWQLLQLEPAALREPDFLDAQPRLTTDGEGLAATLYHLARTGQPEDTGTTTPQPDEGHVYCQVANRLRDLIDDVQDLEVDRDEKRELLTVQVTGKDGTVHPARSLSDGTLRFLALAVLEIDPHTQGVVCLEEPENGIHPARVPAMLLLLRDIATDPDEPVDETNPLRQVIVNTHSPAVVMGVPDDDLLIVGNQADARNGVAFRTAEFRCPSGTWRAKDQEECQTVTKGQFLAYLNPLSRRELAEQAYYTTGEPAGDVAKGVRRRRVMDRPELQPLLWPHVAE